MKEQIKTLLSHSYNYSKYVMLHYVLGSRRLMPPDALQPKAYCTNPGLWSFLLAPPGVSTRDPSSERRNYLGEKWPVISTESCDFHAYTFGFFYMWYGENGFTSLPKEGMLRIFFALKNPTTLAGFEPANLGTKGQHATSRPSKPLAG